MVAGRGAIGLPIVSKFDPKGVNDAQNAFGTLGTFANRMGPMIAGAFAVGAIAAGVYAVKAVEAANESWKVGKALEQAAKNAGTFGATDKDIAKATDALKDHAKTLAELTGIDDEVLLSMEKTWMSVPTLAALGTDGIQHLAEVAADVAAGTGKDVESIGNAFVKVAGDSETAMSKLLRAGIVFTDEQKNTYQAMLDANDEIGAQTYLIDQLDAKYKGMAEASASPIDRMNRMWENFNETVGEALMPALEELAPKLGEALNQMVEKQSFQDFIQTLGDVMMGTVDAFSKFSDWYADNTDLANAIGTAIGIIAIALGVATAAVWAFNIALYANPIGLVVAAIVIGVGLIVAAIWLIASNWQSISKAISLAWDATVYAIGIAWTTVVNGIINGINFVISAFNSLLDIWNMLTGTDFHVDLMATVSGPEQPMSLRSGAVSAQTYTSGGLKLATGGIVMPRPGGTMATIGEAGQAEAVIPLDRLNSMMGGGGGGGATYNVTVNGGLATSADIGRAVVDAIKKYERVSGPVFAGA